MISQENTVNNAMNERISSHKMGKYISKYCKKIKERKKSCSNDRDGGIFIKILLTVAIIIQVE